MYIPSNIVPERRLSSNLLVASPALRDGCFDRKVVFIVEHSSEEGSSGVILNQPTDKNVGDLLATPEFQPVADLPVYFGGPVQSDQLLFVSFKWESETELDCCFQLSLEEAIATRGLPQTDVRAFVGYSSWEQGQLSDELQKNAWFTAFTRPRALETPADKSLWQFVLQGISPVHHLLSLTPEDPTQN